MLCTYGMERKLLEDFCERGLTTRAIADSVGKSQTTIRYWLKRFGLLTNRSKKERDFLCACGETNPAAFHNKGGGRLSLSKCRACHNKYTILRYRRNKSRAVEYKGGQCSVCGYKKCLGSLVFHHRDPVQKDPDWLKMRNWKFEKIKAELDKCDLICSNCHGEIHWGRGEMGSR